MTAELEKKVNQSVSLIRKTVGDNVVEVAYSGGKDSDVILELTKMAGVKYRAIYKNTTIDPVGTVKHESTEKVGRGAILAFFLLI
ncbi:MAG: hypothetical protein Q4G12_05085, partial [Bacteroidales bacterium]|nr:hypothetical protein [Bacteroidales bacterium]